MTYDDDLADRVRSLLPRSVEATEKRMFGGLAFLVGGHMAVAVSGQGGLMVRCAPGDTERLLAEPGAGPMEMRGRELTGWLRVSADAVSSDDDLRRWVKVGVAHTAALPPKEL